MNKSFTAAPGTARTLRVLRSGLPADLHPERGLWPYPVRAALPSLDSARVGACKSHDLCNHRSSESAGAIQVVRADARTALLVALALAWLVLFAYLMAAHWNRLEAEARTEIVRTD